MSELTLPDYSEYLNKEGVFDFIESQWQKNLHIHQAQANAVNKLIEKIDKPVLLEVGCSTGNMAQFISDKAHYTGVDKHEPSIKLAHKKNANKKFKVSDVRTMQFKNDFDIVCAFAIMKHFGLKEWADILEILAAHSSEYLVFDMPITAGDTFDNGNQYGHHHVFMNEQDLMKHAKKLKLELIEKDTTNPVEPIYTFKLK